MKKYFLMLTLLILPPTHAAHAAGRFYAGFGLGEATISEWCKSSPRRCDDSDIGLKLYGGFQITPHWGIEASYVDFGGATGSNSRNALPSFRAEVEGVTLSGTGTLPLSKKLNLFARAGFFRWNLELTRFGSLATERRNRDGTDFTFAFGAAFALTKDIQLRLEWEQFTDIGDQDTSDIDLFSGGMALFF